MLPGTVWLDTARVDGENRRSYCFRRPSEVFVAAEVTEVLPALAAAERSRDEGKWIAGFVAYEAAAAWLPVNVPPLRPPLVWLGAYDAPAPPPKRSPRPVALRELAPELDAHGHARRVEAARALIREGDVYQVNLTFPFRGRLEGTAHDLYLALRRRQPVPFGAFIQTDELAVVSLSPELFFRVAGRRIWTRPMKGTTTRGQTPEEDAHQSAWLRADAKNRAENLMIVDLLRNDLARLTLPGSVRVPALFETEQHRSLIQMTSTVEGQLSPRVSIPEFFEALFPCGSITGAPKLRAMQRIAELEQEPRGLYCGAIGFAAPHEEMTFSVAIRTAEVRGEEVQMGVGSGIVWESDAAAEYLECLLKAQFLTGLAEES